MFIGAIENATANNNIEDPIVSHTSAIDILNILTVNVNYFFYCRSETTSNFTYATPIVVKYLLLAKIEK